MITTNEYTILNKIALNIIVVNKQILLSNKALVDLKTQLGLKDIFVLSDNLDVMLNSNYQNSTLIAEDFKINKDIMISDKAAQTLKLRLGITSKEDQIFVLNANNEIVLNNQLSGEEVNFEAASKTYIPNLYVKDLLELTQEVLTKLKNDLKIKESILNLENDRYIIDTNTKGLKVFDLYISDGNLELNHNAISKLKIDLELKKPIFIYNSEPKTISLDSEFQESLLDLSNISSLKLLSLVEMNNKNIDFKNISTCNFDDLSKNSVKKGLGIQEIFKSDSGNVYLNNEFSNLNLVLDNVNRSDFSEMLIIDKENNSITFKNKNVIFDPASKQSFKQALDTLVLNATKDLYEIIDKKGLALTQLTVDDIISNKVDLSNDSATLLLNQNIIDDLASKLPIPPEPPVVNVVFESDDSRIFPKLEEGTKTFDLKTLPSIDLGTTKVYNSLQFANDTSKNAFKTHIDVPANIFSVKSSPSFSKYIGLNSQYIIGVPMLFETSGGQIKLSCGIDQSGQQRGPMFVEIDRLKITESMKFKDSFTTFFIIENNQSGSKISINPSDVYITGPTETKKNLVFLINSKYTRVESEIRFVDKMHFEITEVAFTDTSKQKFREALDIKDPIPPIPVDSILIIGITPEHDPTLYIDKKYIYQGDTLTKTDLMFLIESKYTKFNSLVTFVEPVSIENTELKLQLTTFNIDQTSKNNLREALEISNSECVWTKNQNVITTKGPKENTTLLINDPNLTFNNLSMVTFDENSKTKFKEALEIEKCFFKNDHSFNWPDSSTPTQIIDFKNDYVGSKTSGKPYAFIMNNALTRFNEVVECRGETRFSGTIKFENSVSINEISRVSFQKNLQFDELLLGIGSLSPESSDKDPALNRINVFDLSDAQYAIATNIPGTESYSYETEDSYKMFENLYKNTFPSDGKTNYSTKLNYETLQEIEDLKTKNITEFVEGGNVTEKINEIIKRVNFLTQSMNSPHLLFLYRIIDTMLLNGKMQFILENVVKEVNPDFKSIINTDFSPESGIQHKYQK